MTSWDLNRSVSSGLACELTETVNWRMALACPARWPQRRLSFGQMRKSTIKAMRRVAMGRQILSGPRPATVTERRIPGVVQPSATR